MSQTKYKIVDNKKQRSQPQKHFDFKPQSIMDDDIASSCCDYQSDIFKEQLSCENFSQVDDNYENQYNQYDREELMSGSITQTPQELINYQQRTLHQGKSQKVVGTKGCIGGIQNYQKKQSVISNENPHHKVNTTTLISSKNQRKPLFSLVPDKMNKYANSSQQDIAMIQSQQFQQVEKVQNGAQKMTQNQMVLYCEESELFNVKAGQLNLQGTQQSSQLILTPQKSQPVPISPTQRPILSNVSSVSNTYKLVDDKFNHQLQLQKSDSKLQNNKSSAQKAIVVYDEFKYYSQSNNYNNMIHMMSKDGKNGSFSQQKNDSGQYVCEIVNSDGQMFDIISPKSFNGTERITLKQNIQTADRNQPCSVKKQLFGFGNYATNQSGSDQESHFQRNNSLPSKQEVQPFMMSDQSKKKFGGQGDIRSTYIDEDEEINILMMDKDKGRNFEQVYKIKIKQLQEHVGQLERDLKLSKDKNSEMLTKFKDKNNIQSFEKSRQDRASLKHLSDTEDSLILSEKKKSRTSNQRSQNQSSIMDVKIKPIINLRQNIYPAPAQQIKQQQVYLDSLQENSLLVQEEDQNQQLQDQDDEEIQYQVQSFEDQDGGRIHSTNEAQSQNEGENQENQENQEEDNDQQSVESHECDSCERLKQLVFQAKEAIDDLKLEIEEWRDIAATKETELRAIQHKIYNDLIGVQKNVEFNEHIQTKEFDTSRPVNVDANKVRNFIMHNKKKLRSRSKNENKQGESQSKQNKLQQSNKKKSALKKVQDIMSDEDIEFYQAEDQCCQTSFTMENQYSSQQTDNNNNNQELHTFRDSKSPEKAVDMPFRSRQNSIPLNSLRCNGSNVLTTLSQQSPNIATDPKSNRQKENNAQPFSTLSKLSDSELTQQLQAQQESMDQQKSKNLNLEAEVQKLRLQVTQLAKANEAFSSLVNKVKRKNKQNKNTQQTNLNEIKQNCQIMSQLESYSILEKINEWKKEEGLNGAFSEMPVSRIPRPVKLIQDIDEDEIFQINQQIVASQTTTTTQSLLDKIDMNSILKKERNHLQQTQDQKYEELLKYQNDYLQQQIKTQLSHNKELYSTSSSGLKQDTLMAAVDSYIKRETTN